MNSHKLAVYGTLKKGWWNHKYLGDSVILGSCWIDNFALASEGTYPAAFRFPGKKIWVEVYKVDDITLAHTDRLEGVERGYYERVTIPTSLHGDVFMYARPHLNLEGYSTMWYPDGIWDGAATYKTQWLGWQAECRLRDEAAARQAKGINNYPGHRSGRTRREINPVTGEVEYVPCDAAEWAADNKDKLKDIPVVGTSCSVELRPTKPTHHELARAKIKEGVEKAPEIPKEEIA